MFNQLIFSIMFICSFAPPISSWASAPPLLVYDSNPSNEDEPEHFRMSPPPIDAINRNELEALKIIGSGAFTQKQLEKITAGKETVCIVDLREETHGFINGEPVCWYQGMNTANEGKKPEEIAKEEAEIFSKIEPGSRIPIARISQKTNGLVENYNWDFILVESAATEEELIKSEGLLYHRFFVTNHKRPSDGQVDAFLDFFSTLPQDAWLYFHCRAGSGRTTTFMVLYDILRNGKSSSLEKILQRQIRLGGKELLTLPSKESHKYDSALERKLFIENFYHYVASGAAEQQSWSEWANSI